MIWIVPSSTEYLSARTSSGLPSLSPVPSWPVAQEVGGDQLIDHLGGVTSARGVASASSSPASCSRTIWSSGRSALNARMT